MSDRRYTDPDFAAVALITIDMQQDVLDGGPLEIPSTSEAGQRIVRLAQAFRDANRPIVHMVRLYEPNGSNVDPCRREAVQRDARILTPGRPGSQLALELPSTSNQQLDDAKLLAAGIQRLGPSEVVIYKPRWGAFYRTPLERHLRARNVSTLVFCGCNFPNCLRTSIYEASERDFRIVLVRDAVSGLYQGAEEELGNIGGHLLDTDDVLDALHSRHAYAPSSRP